MVATTTAFNSLQKKLELHYPELTFTAGDEFRWSPQAYTVWFIAGSDDTVTLLHETAHGLLGHSGYAADIELLRLERDAWTKATELGQIFGVTISTEHIEDALDTYRDWLHARSLCPSCKQNGVQKKGDQYSCLVCGQKWHANDARHCGLKRQKL